MKKIIKIVCSMTMGYSPGVIPTKEKLTLTECSVKFKGQYPRHQDDVQIIDWSIRSNSLQFQEQFYRICETIPNKIMRMNQLEVWGCNTGTGFTIYYEDKTKEKYDFGIPPTEFSDLLKLIKPLIPPVEELPILLQGMD